YASNNWAPTSRRGHHSSVLGISEVTDNAEESPKRSLKMGVASLESVHCFIHLPAMLSPTSVKDALNQTAPVAPILVQGWVRTRRDSKDFSFIELNDGSSLRSLQIIARNSLSNYGVVQRLITGASISVRGALVASQGKGQNWELVADEVTIVARRTTAIPCRRRDILRSSSAKSRICVRAQIFLVVFFAFAAGSPSPFTNSSRNVGFTTFIRQSSLAATAKERASYFASLPSTPVIRHESQMARLTTPGISSVARPT